MHMTSSVSGERGVRKEGDRGARLPQEGVPGALPAGPGMGCSAERATRRSRWRGFQGSGVTRGTLGGEAEGLGETRRKEHSFCEESRQKQGLIPAKMAWPHVAMKQHFSNAHACWALRTKVPLIQCQHVCRCPHTTLGASLDYDEQVPGNLHGRCPVGDFRDGLQGLSSL